MKVQIVQLLLMADTALMQDRQGRILRAALREEFDMSPEMLGSLNSLRQDNIHTRPVHRLFGLGASKDVHPLVLSFHSQNFTRKHDTQQIFCSKIFMKE